MKRRSAALLRAVLVLWICLGLPPEASGAIVCVPADMTLAAALNQAQSSPTTIHLVQGTYDLAATVWHWGYLGGTLVRSGSELVGGYTAGCAGRNIGAGNTKLTDSAAGANADGVLVKGDLTIEGITFELHHGFVLFVENVFGGIVFNSGGKIVLSRDAFLDTSGNALSINWLQYPNVAGTIRIVDTLIANNASPYCFVAVIVDGGAPDVDFINNTIYGNTTGAGACFYNHYNGGVGGTTYNLYNNIFYGTAGSFDLYTDDTSVALVDNVIGTRSGPAPAKNLNTQTGDPKLDANYKPIEVPASPVINAGYNSPPGGLPSLDLTGNPRQVGPRVDRGAYESSLDYAFLKTVTKTVDDGTSGTLRDAITAVNSNGSGEIRFDIGSGCGPHVITLDHTKPDLALAVDSTIDGYSQTGAAPNDLDLGDDATICVILESDGSDTRGLVVPSTADDTTNVTIQGLGFSGFSTTGIDLQGGSEHVVDGNHFGGTIGGHAMLPNGFDIRLGAATHDDVIGSDDVADRNIVGDATGSGIVIASGATNNQILNNYIGIGWNPNTSVYTNRGNGARGIYVAGDGTTINGNLIGNNAQAGIVLDSGGAHDNVIAQNSIGADSFGSVFANASGIHLIGDSGGTGDAPNDNNIRLNVIAANTAQGVLIDVGQRNKVRRNSIYANGALGIDLGAVGPAVPQSDDGGFHLLDEANRTQNFPILTLAGGDTALGTVAGSLTTTAGDYTLDFYITGSCDDSGYGQGGVWLAAATVTVPVPVSGNQSTEPFSVQINAPLLAPLFDGSTITATATDSLGNTSEFSACATYSNTGIFANGFDPPAI